MLYLGTIGLILLFIFEPITFFIPCNIEEICYEGHFAGIISGFKLLSDLKDYMFVFCFLIFLFMTACGLWMTVIFLSPSHFLTSDSIITVGLNIVIETNFNNFILLKNPIFYILSLFIIIGCLVYNEIIIIKVFGLYHNTRKEILRRENRENIQNKDNYQKCLLYENMDFTDENEYEYNDMKY